MSDHAHAIVAGWYDDPDTPGQYRWWDGSAWTKHRLTAAEHAASEDGSSSEDAAAAAIAAAAAAHLTLVREAAMEAAPPPPAAAPRAGAPPAGYSAGRLAATNPKARERKVVAISTTVVVVSLAWMFLGQQQPDPDIGKPDPRPGSAQSATLAPTAGSDTPEVIDDATGGGIDRARDLASDAEGRSAELDTAAQAGSEA